MKGFIRKVVAMLGSTGALAGMAGCYDCRDVIDPCYPQRYEFQTRQNVHAAFAPQVRNAFVLDQTVWNYQFEEGSDRLTPGGLERLRYIGRRRPTPDPMVFVQTAQDVAYSPEKPEEMVKRRYELDQRRVEAVKKFLAAQTSGGSAAPFEVLVHNPPEVGIPSAVSETSLRLMVTTPRATLPGTGGSSGGGGGGSSGGGGGR